MTDNLIFIENLPHPSQEVRTKLIPVDTVLIFMSSWMMYLFGIVSPYSFLYNFQFFKYNAETPGYSANSLF